MLQEQSYLYNLLDQSYEIAHMKPKIVLMVLVLVLLLQLRARKSFF